MATRIECVNKDPREDPHKRIENVGGSGWKISESEAIRNIENGESYEVSAGGQTVSVIIAEHEATSI